MNENRDVFAAAIAVTIGATLRRTRNAQRMSLEELARRVGVTYQQVQKYESGANRISSPTLILIAEALGCTPAHLMSDAVPDMPRTLPRAPSLRALQLAVKTDHLSEEAFRQIDGIVDTIIEASDRSVTTSPHPAPRLVATSAH